MTSSSASNSSVPSSTPEAAAPAVTLKQAKEQHTRQLRQSVVRAAADLLQEHGPQAVTVRRVAERMECSTKIIYSLFAKKEGLAQQLYLEGCRQLSDTLDAVEFSGDLAADLHRTAEAYWRFGQEHTAFYQVMFGGAFADFKPDEESLAGMVTAFSRAGALVDAAKRAGAISADLDTLETVRLIWAPLHGVVHLYLTGQIGDLAEARSVYDRTVTMIGNSLIG